MIYLVVFLAFLFTAALVAAGGEYWFSKREQVQSRLAGIRQMETASGEEDLLRLPALERLVKPALRNIGKTLGSLTPGEIRSWIEQQIVCAGNPWQINFNILVAAQVLAGAAFFLLSVGLFSLLQLEGGRLLILSLIMALVGLLLPVAVVNSRAESRKLSIQKSLPDWLDLLLVSVEAGLGFDMALKRVASQMPGSLSEEVNRAVEEIRMGSSREEALRGVARRTGVSDLSSFISAIIQAEQLGSSIGATLRVQAASMRQKRRQRVEEIAMKAPIKMIFPLLFFIFPALFVVILGPAGIRIFQMFQSML
jgi:tight adherence protein C